MAGLLEGLQVVDMGHVVAVPSAAAMMADWGADVIKVEPLSGEMARKTARSYRKSREIRVGGSIVNWAFELHNRGKKGLAVDLKKRSGKKIVYRLVEKADIFISNYAAGALKRLEMDYDTLKRMNPKIIYGSVTGYGRVGPDKDEKGFDITAAWARSGAQHMTADPACAPPMQRGGLMDRTTASYLVAGLLAALRHRDRTGKGQEIEISLYNTGVWSIASDIQSVLVDQTFPRNDHFRAPNPLSNNYRTRDDRWIILLNPLFERVLPGLCRAIEREELADDSRFNSQAAMERNCELFIGILDEVFASKDLAEWERRLRENNVVYGKVQTPTETAHDPQAIANHFFADVVYPGGDEIKLLNTPVKFRENPAAIKGPAPRVGQHTEEILFELGYNGNDMARLKADGVIGP
jgi:crotonobetainyl-CoA:carnitine CoA-transferase CaiB-like acyl-CoA transferase